MIKKERVVIGDIINQYTEVLLKSEPEQINIYFDDLQTKSNSKNTENIESGISGYLLVLLEIYRVNNSNNIYEKIIDIKNYLINYCKENKTSNFSLYTGRMGVVYFLIKLYNLNKDKQTLTECINLLKNPEFQYYIQSKHTPVYFHNGLAGSLLVLLKLSDLIQSDTFTIEIEEIASNIIKSSTYSEEGISWNSKFSHNVPNSCGFAFGAAGIYYVLNKIETKNTLLLTYTKDIKKYIDSKWNKNEELWENFEIEIFDKESFLYYYNEIQSNPLFHQNIGKYNLSWYSGIIGISMATETSNSIKNALVNLYNEKQIYEYHPKQLIGIGYFLMEYLSKIGDDEELIYILEEINDFLIKFLISKKPELRGGVMYGEIGIILYFIKFLYSENKEIDILCPFNDKFNNVTFHLKSVDDHIAKIYTSGFHKTIKFLHYLTKRDNASYVDITKEKIINNIDDQIDNLKSHSIYEVIIDCFEYEKKCYDLLQITETSFFCEIIAKKQILEKLNSNLTDIKTQNIRKSSNISIVKSQWNWSLPLDNIFLNYETLKGEYGYILVNNKILPLSIDSIIFDCFDQESTIAKSYNHIKNICENLDEKDLIPFIKSSGSKDKAQFLERLEFLITHRIMHFLYENILVFV